MASACSPAPGLAMRPPCSRKSPAALKGGLSTSTRWASMPVGSCSRAKSKSVQTSPFTSTKGCSPSRSEEHTSELQSRPHLVCRLLLEKKKKKAHKHHKLHTTH